MNEKRKIFLRLIEKGATAQEIILATKRESSHVYKSLRTHHERRDLMRKNGITENSLKRMIELKKGIYTDIAEELNIPCDSVISFIKSSINLYEFSEKIRAREAQYREKRRKEKLNAGQAIRRESVAQKIKNEDDVLYHPCDFPHLMESSPMSMVRQLLGGKLRYDRRNGYLLDGVPVKVQKLFEVAGVHIERGM